MTFWDFLSNLLNNFSISWILLIVAIIALIWTIGHPDVAEKWNVMIHSFVAAFAPRARKKAFAQRVNLVVHSARKRFGEQAPEFMQKFIPYDLSIEWVDEDSSVESFMQESQVVIYVSSYKDEARQAIGILHNYCVKGFAEKAKVYMSERIKKASDLIITQKLVQCGGPRIFEYYNREYLPEVLKKNKSCATAYYNLGLIDKDGLFIPVLLNELDKFANNLYPTPPNDQIYDTISNFCNFINTIVNKAPGERVNNKFSQNGIKVKIILAVSDGTYNILPIVQQAEVEINNHSVNTIYVLASGGKIKFAEDIANEIYKRNSFDVTEPKKKVYKRQLRTLQSCDAACYEIEVIN